MADLDPESLKRLNPFNAMGEDHLPEIVSQAEVLEHVTVDAIPKGKMIFKRDEEDSCGYWLLEGSVDLLDDNFNVTRRAAGEEGGEYALDNTNPHELTVVTTSDVRVLKVARKVVGEFLEGLPAEDFDPGEYEDEVDWMSSLLSSPLFEFIPPTNIQTLFSKFEEMQGKRGDVIVRQGDKGDYFYPIKSGRAVVERTSGGKRIQIAKLKAGNNFGQDALVTDVPRNATVTMTTTGTLMRLSEPDFESLLMHPVIETMALESVNEMIEAGEPRTYSLDVCNPKEVEEGGKIDGTLNLPLLVLRKSLPKHKPDAVYVIASDGGKRSELGAYILNENGFSAYVLEQGQASA